MRKRILCGWEVDRIQKGLDEVLDFLSSQQRGVHTDWAPAVDLLRQEDSFMILVDLPGVEREEIEIKLRGLDLTISGRKPLARGRGNPRHCLQMERGFGNFCLELSLPGPVSPAGSAAKLANGLLEVRLRRIDERRQTVHAIPIDESKK